MWQTIQLLLGPEEHSSFLMEAVQRWDVKDPITDEVFPKVLPRECFPAVPDKHMIAWYEGVSERLRREAEEEERQREIEAQQAETRRLHDKKREEPEEDEESVDSRGPALAYFRNPLYRHVDGRPSIVRRNSKRPQLSPRRTSMKDKGKEAATSVGHVIRNIGSPHLWDGSARTHSKTGSRDRRRRSSLPDNRYKRSSDQPESNGRDPRYGSSSSSSHHQRHRSGQSNREVGTPADVNRQSPPDGISPGTGTREDEDNNDPSLRHSRSHEPTPSQREYSDYFEGYDNPNLALDPTHDSGGTPISSNGLGPHFGPSASPLFAAQVAKHPQSYAPRSSRPASEQYGPTPRYPPGRRSQDRPYNSSPGRNRESQDRDDRRHSSRGQDIGRRHSRDRDKRRPSSRDRDSRRPSSRDRGDSRRRSSRERHPHFDSKSDSYRDDRSRRRRSSYGSGPPIGNDRDDRRHSHHSPTRSESRRFQGGGDRRSGARASESDARGGSDVGGPEDREGRRNNGQKQTRFAAGVGGRSYPNESSWR